MQGFFGAFLGDLGLRGSKGSLNIRVAAHGFERLGFSTILLKNPNKVFFLIKGNISNIGVLML